MWVAGQDSKRGAYFKFGNKALSIACAIMSATKLRHSVLLDSRRDGVTQTKLDAQYLIVWDREGDFNEQGWKDSRACIFKEKDASSINHFINIPAHEAIRQY